jgi:hypothetical protein
MDSEQVDVDGSGRALSNPVTVQGGPIYTDTRVHNILIQRFTLQRQRFIARTFLKPVGNALC